MRSLPTRIALGFLGLFVMFLRPVTVSGQEATQPPAPQHTVLTLQGRGVQIYYCRRDAGTFHWGFAGPAARLFSGDREVGTHGDGPVWHSEDGSSIHGQLLAQSPAPDPTAIPWLLLRAVLPEGSGILSTVEYIRRSDTQGGIAPTAGCDAQHEGAFARIPYTATYSFFSAK